MTARRISVSPIVDTIAADMGLIKHDIRTIIITAPIRYKTYKIVKKNGGMRFISQPSREVKALQYWFMARCSRMFRIHSDAMGYRKGTGIKHNAAKHASSEYILKMDFADFFPSIRAWDFDFYIKTQTPWILDADDIGLASRLLFRKAPVAGKGLRLSIGAPTSPWLSNVLMFRFDLMVSQICLHEKVTYSRYADDLTFSSNLPDALRNVERQIRGIVSDMESPRLAFNPKKTIMLSRKMQRRITGLVLSNEGKVSLGRERKRTIRAALHHLAHGALKESEIIRLQGLLAFAKDVEPEFTRRLARRYGAELVFGQGRQARR